MKKMSIFIGAVLYPAHGQWVDLPATEEELEEAIENAQTEDCEEVMISDSEGIECNEYSNIFEVNEQAEQIEELEEYEQEILEALTDDGYNFEEALDIVQDGDYMYYGNCSNMAEVAMEYIEETGLLNDVPEHLQNYFDYEAYGRDMSFEGHFIATDSGYIEVLR